MSSELIEILSNISFFQAMPDWALKYLAERVEKVSLTADEVLFNKGDEGDSLYILTEGQVKMVSADADGKELVLNQVGPGSIIGEMALLDSDPRSAGVIAVGTVKMLKLNQDDFSKILADDPKLHMEISRNLSRRLRFATTYIELAIEWSQQIAEGNYGDVIDDINEDMEIEDSRLDSDRAHRFLGTFFQMAKDVKAREEELKQELQKLKIEIDQVKRKKEVDEIASSDFFQQLRDQKGENKEK